MKTLVLLFALMASTQSFASGKLSVGTKYFSHTDEFRPILGFSVYEKIMKNKLYFNGWAGIGQVPNRFEETTTWRTVKLGLDVPVMNWKWIFSGSFATQDTDPWNERINSVELKASYRLW